MRTMGNMKKSITADSDFAAWAAARSQKTNRSLAGARLAIPEPQKHAEIKSQAQQWGMTVEDATMTDEHNEEFLCDGTQSIDSITDMRKASGLEAMEYAEQHMPVLRDTMDSLTTRVDFSGIRIAVCLILEPKTAILLRKLKAAGAIVGVYCGPDSDGIPEWRNSCAGKESRSNPAETGPRNRRTRRPCTCWTKYSRTSSSTMVPASPVSLRSNAPNSRRTSLEWPRKSTQRRTRVPADAGSGSPHLPGRSR